MEGTKLTRFPRGASQEQRRVFGRDLLEALDLLGVKPGEDFLVGPVHLQAEIPPESDGNGKPDDPALGPFARDSDTSRQAALDNYPRAGSQRWRVLSQIARAGGKGLTRDELSRILDMRESSVHPRVWELVNGEFIVDDEEIVRKTQQGSDAHALVLTEKGKAWQREHAHEQPTTGATDVKQ